MFHHANSGARNVTHRWIQAKCDHTAHDHPFVDTETGLVIDPETGEVLGHSDFLDALTPDQVESLACQHTCPNAQSLQEVANRLIADAWDYLQIPDVQHWAMDSYVLQTHYRARSWGKLVDIDPDHLPEDHPYRERTIKAGLRSSGKPAGGKAVKPDHWAVARALREEWERRQESSSEDSPAPKSRRPPAVGPTMPGAFTRFDSTFPQIGPDLRARHTVDAGATNGFVGAGRSRRSSIANGRDKHTLVACDFLPDGTPIPPFLRSFAVTTAGGAKAASALTAFTRAQESGAEVRTVRLDRIYTVETAEALARPAAAAGVDLIIDLKGDQRRPRPWQPGVIFVDGFFFTSGIPEALLELPRWPMSCSREVRQAHHQAFDERAAFAFQKNRTLPSGTIQFRGPCYVSEAKRDRFGRLISYRTDRVTARCPNHPDFRALPRHLPKTSCTPESDCICGRTFTVDPEALPNTYEPLLWGTTKWSAVYHRRNLVESFNSVEQYHRRVDAHTIQVRDKKWDLMHLFVALGTMFVMFYNWMARLGAPRDATVDPLDPEVVRACLARVTTPTPPGRAPAQRRSARATE